MLPYVIAVDETLSAVRQYLEDNGYETTGLEEGLNEAAVIVVSGMDRDFLGDETITAEVPVIDAAGLTADEVLGQVERKIQFKH